MSGDWTAPESGWYEWQSGQGPRKIADPGEPAAVAPPDTLETVTWSDWRGVNLPVTDWTEVLRRGVAVRIVRDDGTEDEIEPEIGTDGRWSYLVPGGVRAVAGYPVASGDTISGEITW